MNPLSSLQTFAGHHRLREASAAAWRVLPALTATAAVAASLFLASQSARAGNTNLVFTQLPDVYSAAPGGSFYMALQDLNHDGKPDLVKTVLFSGTDFRVSVQLGNGDGTFGTASFYPVGTNPGQVVVGDFNNDGIPDLLVPNLNDETISVLLGNGDGTFRTQIVTNIGLVATSVAVADINKDGKLDLIVTGYKESPLEGYVETFLGNGDGTFGSGTLLPASEGTLYSATACAAVADFNGDGWPDFIVSDPNQTMLRVFLNNHDGTFTAQPSFLAGGFPGRMVTGDFNGDGKADIAVVMFSDENFGSSNPNDNISVALGNGDGTFGAFQAYTAGSTADYYMAREANIVAADMDGDGHLDLVTIAEPDSGANGLVSYISILRGAANGTFTPAQLLTVTDDATWVCAGDLNQDGEPDLVESPNGPEYQTFIAGDAAYLKPAVEMPGVFYVKASSAEFEAIRTSNGDAAATKFGILYSPSLQNTNPMIGGGSVYELDSPNPLSTVYQVTANSMIPNTTYSAVSFAVNSYGTVYSPVTNFTTLTGPAGSLVVNTLLDITNTPGFNSLRDAINYAYELNDVATVTFDPSLFAGGPATLSIANNTSYNPIIIQGLGGKLTIVGPGPNQLTISGSNQTQIFNNSGPNVELDNLTMANSLGSAIISVNNLICSNVVFNGNNAGYESSGGAIFSLGPLTLINCLFTNNAAGSGGAVSADNSLSVQGSAFVNNQAGINSSWQTNGSGQGGAIYAPSTFYGFSVINSTFIGNQARNGTGGAAEVEGNRGASMVNCTFTGNVADEAGGGIEVITISGYPLAVINCIISGNTAPTNTDIDPVGSYGATNCLISANVATIFGGNAPANNGGLTPTIALNPTGPAINAGNNALIPAGITTDQRGQPRNNDGTVDIGAYEYQFVPPAITSGRGVIFLTGLSNVFNFAATGVPAAGFSVSGSLPSGVSFTGSGLAGKPPYGSGGSYIVTVGATNGIAPGATQSFTITVMEPNTFAAHPNLETNGLGWALNGDSVNGGPSIVNNVFTPTDGSNGETRSAWFRYPLYVGGFKASFTYQDIGGGGADGTAFVIQNSSAGASALGGGGGGLGYIGISRSVALMLDIYSGASGGPSGWLATIGGAGNGGGYSSANYQSTAPVNLDSGDPVAVSLRYTGNLLQISLTDTVTSANFQTNVAINIPANLGTNAAWVGFTGSEGGATSHQAVSNFSYAPLPVLSAANGGPNTIIFSWPASAYGFQLQSSASLSGASWADVPGTITQANSLNQMEVTKAGPAQYYRLVLP